MRLGLPLRLLLVLLLPVLLSTVAALPATAGPAAPAWLAAASPAAPARRAAAPRRPVVLPDSVLLRLQTPGFPAEDITRRRFLRAVRLMGSDPDSLTPAERDRFLELVVEQRVLATWAARTPEPWPRADSMQFLGERDNILLRAALADEFLRLEARRRALGQPDLDEQAMGIAARESLMVELKPEFDRELLKVVGSYFAELPQPTPDMTPMQQIALTREMPKVPAADTGKVLARSRLGEFRVSELLDDWRRLSSIYRPHVKDDEGVRALVQNSLFERLIREAAERPALAERPEVAAVIADRIEYHAVSNVLQREVVARIATDSLTLLKYFRAHRADFDRPAHARLVLLHLGTEQAADSMAQRFTIPGEAETLAVRAEHGGVNYALTVTAQSDPELYAQCQRIGVGGVSAPAQGDAGWRVFKVLALEPSAPRSFDEARPEIERAWYEFESERRIRALLDGLKQKAVRTRNEAALRALVLRPAGTRP